jgi:ParB family transcriptional regulator, chromosome partitioning protein
LAMIKRNALGKGLSALIPEPPPPTGPGILQLDVGLIDASSRQPRGMFEGEALKDLAQSIREHGVLQPVIVSRDGDRYRLIAGERRWRAALMAGLDKLPAVVRQAGEQQRLELALVENIQRQDLNPMEEARAYGLLLKDFSLSHEDVAQRVGKSRPHVSNLLRLLALSPEVQRRVETGRLSMGHARALAGLPDMKSQAKVAAQVVDQDLSVRRTEALVARHMARRGGKGSETTRGEAMGDEGARRDPNVRAAEERLKRALGATVRIVGGADRGRIEIEYVSARELQRLFETLERADRAAPAPPALETRVRLPGAPPAPSSGD